MFAEGLVFHHSSESTSIDRYSSSQDLWWRRKPFQDVVVERNRLAYLNTHVQVHSGSTVRLSLGCLIFEFEGCV